MPGDGKAISEATITVWYVISGWNKIEFMILNWYNPYFIMGIIP